MTASFGDVLTHAERQSASNAIKFLIRGSPDSSNRFHDVAFGILDLGSFCRGF
jgi:hypothetical protein